MDGWTGRQMKAERQKADKLKSKWQQEQIYLIITLICVPVPHPPMNALQAGRCLRSSLKEQKYVADAHVYTMPVIQVLWR